MSDLAAALAALQADLPRIKRTKRGAHGKYPPYDEIQAAVRPVMAQHGFMWNSRPMLVEMGATVRFVLHYELTHLPSQTALNGFYPLTEGPPQQQGAVISYAQRYCLKSVLDLEVEGEDNMDAPTRRPVRSKTTGPEHERVREGLHTATPGQRAADRGPLPPEADPWLDQPAGVSPLNDPEDKPGSIAKRQRDAMHAKFTELGISDRAERLTMTRRLLDLDEISSSNDLSYRQAGRLLQALQELTTSRRK